MRSRTAITRLLVVALSSISLSVGLRAQCFYRSTLPVSFSTRGLAMGDANSAGSDADVIFYNPAQLAVARGVTAAIARFDVYDLGSVAAVQPLGNGGIGVAVTYGSASELPCGTDTPPYGYPNVSGHRLHIMGGGGFTVGPVHLGSTLKFSEVQYGGGSVWQLAADLGLSGAFGNDRQRTAISFAVQNLGARERDYITLTPLRLVLGTWTDFSAGRFNVAVASQLAYRRYNFADPSERDLIPAIGMEIGHALGSRARVAVRGGMRRTDEYAETGNRTGGAGLTIRRVSVDYAVEEIVGFHSSPVHRLGIRVGTQ